MTEAGRSRPTQRVETVDLLRGWAILLVVVGHAVQWTVGPEFDAHPAFRLIYSFHMPLFFFISGIVGESGVRRPLGQVLRSKTLGLLVPFVSWWFLVSVVSWLRGAEGLQQALLAVFRSPDNGLWFLWVLFVVTLVAAAALRLVPERLDWAGLVGAGLLLWAVRLPVLGLSMVAWYFPFFASGILMSALALRNSNGYLGTNERGRVWLAGAAVSLAWVALALGWRRADLVWPARQWLAAGYPIPRLIDIPYRYLTAAAGIGASVIVVPRAIRTGSRTGGVMTYLGRSTLEVYVSHTMVLGLFTGAGLLLAPVAAAAALGGSLALAWVLKKVPLARLTLYGDRPWVPPSAVLERGHRERFIA